MRAGIAVQPLGTLFVTWRLALVAAREQLLVHHAL